MDNDVLAAADAMVADERPGVRIEPFIGGDAGVIIGAFGRFEDFFVTDNCGGEERGVVCDDIVVSAIGARDTE